MKTMGLLGGMSWESTLEYYRLLNEGVKERLGGLHSAKIILHSIDFSPLEQLLQKGDWYGIATILADAAVGLEKAGAEFILICTNTMHKVAPDIESRLKIPLLHIAEAAGRVLKDNRIEKVGLLGTSFTMEEDFYRQRLLDTSGIEVVIPNQADRDIVNRVIFQELCLGKVTEEAKAEYIRIIAALQEEGAEAVLLGCTEIGMLISPEDVELKIYDTTSIHAAAAVDMALE